MNKIFLILALSLFISACSSSDKDVAVDVPIEDKPASEIYDDAQSSFDRGRFIESANLFNEVERLYPYSDLAQDAQLLAGVSYYKSERYDEAIIAMDRYIQLYPGNENLDYAYYLRAVSYYDQITDVRRDQEITRLALDNLNLLIRRFPDSRYARDAEYKRDLTLDHLAGKDMDIGRYYLTRGYYQAGINRFINVVRDYQTTTHVPEAMHRLVESYLALGLEEEAFRIAVVMGHNYPGSEWYSKTYDLLNPETRKRILENRSFVDKTIDSIFRPK